MTIKSITPVKKHPFRWHSSEGYTIELENGATKHVPHPKDQFHITNEYLAVKDFIKRKLHENK